MQLPEPVNQFPDFVRHIVQQLKVLCPSLGKVKIAQMLAKASLHLCATTVGMTDCQGAGWGSSFKATFMASWTSSSRYISVVSVLT